MTALFEVPNLAEHGAKSLQMRTQVLLTPSDLEAIGHAWSLDANHRDLNRRVGRIWVGMSRTSEGINRLSHEATIRRLTDEQLELWRTLITPTSVPGEQDVALLTLEIDATRLLYPIESFDKQRTAIDAIWEWMEPKLPADMISDASFVFQTTDYAPAIDLAAWNNLPGGFTAIEGLRLVNRRLDDDKQPLLYSVDLKLDKAELSAEVRFRYLLNPKLGMSEVISYANRLATLAVVPVVGI